MVVHAMITTIVYIHIYIYTYIYIHSSYLKHALIYTGIAPHLNRQPRTQRKAELEIAFDCVAASLVG